MHGIEKPMLSEFPAVSIVIVNWNGTRDTIECVESLKKIDYPLFNIIIVDNGSSPKEISLLHSILDSDCKIIELKRNLGFAIANNIGIRSALQKGAPFVLLLNNDTVVDKSFLNELVSASGKDTKKGIMGPKMYLYDDRTRLWYAGGRLNMYLGHKTEGLSKVDEGQFNITKPTDYIAGAGMLIRKEVFNDIGLLPREYFLGWEDIDFCVAARKKGYDCIFVASSIIWHKASASFKRENLNYRQVFFGFRNRVIIRYKFLSKPQFAIFLLLHFVVIIPIHVAYYAIVYKDILRVKNMFKGLAAGLTDMRRRRIVHSFS